MNQDPFLTYGEALAIMNRIRPELKTERVRLVESLKRVLAEDLIADADVPAFDRSAMDGYACRKADLGKALTIAGEIPAGTVPTRAIGQQECMRIMTGAMLPSGADVVVKKEDAEFREEGKVVSFVQTGNDNIRKKGEDVRKGDMMLKAGCLLDPRHIALLASGGMSEPLVYRQPTVAVISTGNELVSPDTTPALGQIRDSNGPQLVAQTAQLGIPATYLGMVRDDREQLMAVVSEAIRSHSVTLLSGGVSVGDYDYIPEILNNIGVALHFHRISVKPGRHLLFGEKDGHYLFGFPGNPLSSFVMFELLVKPFLLRCMGHSGQSAGVMLPLAAPFLSVSPDLVQFLPVVINAAGQAETVSYHGSAHIHAYAGADGIMEIPARADALSKGESVRVHLL